MKEYKSLYAAMNKSNVSMEKLTEILELAMQKTHTYDRECVYFISDGTFTKIGKATDVFKRLNSLQTGNAKELRLLGVAFPHDLGYQTAFELENHLHRMLRRYCVRGEFYRIDDGEIIQRCDIIFADYFCHRIVNDGDYHDLNNRCKIHLIEAIDPDLMYARLKDRYKRKIYADDCLVGLDKDYNIRGLNTTMHICTSTEIGKAKIVVHSRIED